MRVLVPDLALGLDALGPVHEEWVGHATAIRLALPSPERGVAGEGPAPRVVVEVFRPAEVVQRREVLLQFVGHVVEEFVLVDRAVRPALGARTVVRDDHDQRVVQLAGRLEEIEQAPDLVVGVLEESGEYLHHAGVEPALVLGELVPLLHVGVVPRQHRVLGDDAQFLLPREDLLAVGVPAVVELALVLVGPFLWHLMRCVIGTRCEVEKERLFGRDLFEVGDELDGLVGEVHGEVVTLLGGLRRLDLMVVEDQVGIVLVSVAAEEAVVAVEAATQRPAVVGACGADLFRRRQMPFADAEGGIAVGEQHLGQETVLERDRSIGAGVARRTLGDAGHGVGVVVPPVQHA